MPALAFLTRAPYIPAINSLRVGFGSAFQQPRSRSFQIAAWSAAQGRGGRLLM